MSEFTIRSESVDVEQIMKQIRQRILEKRGADYTEEQIRELASVRLEKFLEPKNLRSDLLDQFRKSRPAVNTEPPTISPPYGPDEADIFATHRGALRFLRKLFNPLLKLMFNPNPLLHVIHKQAEFNVMLLKRESRRKIEFDRSRAEWNALYYEVLHNLVIETTRMGIEAQNLRMRVESLSSRLDFSERRVRALEGVVQYRPEVVRGHDRHDQDDDEPAPMAQGGELGEGFVPTSQPAPGGGQGQGQGQGQQGQGDGAARRKRRRRRGRRGGAGEAGQAGGLNQSGGSPQQGGSQHGGPQQPGGPEASEAGDDDGPDDGDDFDESEAPAALEASAPEAPEAREAPAAPEAPSAPETPQAPKAPWSSDDGQQ